MAVDGIDDTSEEKDSLTPHFRATSRFIEQARTDGGKVLVHCWRGKSRSVTIVIAYLIKYHGLTPKAALRLIQETRPKANPNGGYWKELQDYKKLLKRKEIREKREQHRSR